MIKDFIINLQISQINNIEIFLFVIFGLCLIIAFITNFTLKENKKRFLYTFSFFIFSTTSLRGLYVLSNNIKIFLFDSFNYKNLKVYIENGNLILYKIQKESYLEKATISFSGNIVNHENIIKTEYVYMGDFNCRGRTLKECSNILINNSDKILQEYALNKEKKAVNVN